MARLFRVRLAPFLALSCALACALLGLAWLGLLAPCALAWLAPLRASCALAWLAPRLAPWLGLRHVLRLGLRRCALP